MTSSLFETQDGIARGNSRLECIDTIRRCHYTRSTPSGKSHYIRYGQAIIVWSIPSNYNIGKYLGMEKAKVWELSRLWAPDGHRPNLLTQAISYGVSVLRQLEHPDILVSYADPNVGHSGGVYRAASWIYHGQSSENRSYRGDDGHVVARRSFHSGAKGLRKSEIEALGYEQISVPGKHRFIKPLSKSAKRLYR